ncbi:ubiquitin-related modifier 1-like [Rutidosis leptorrhynchoides]|uniref:ubiquitin-related modifier 1-like n=1 Tax=Rutidosis leptorrhynchoides TaxID=125765 RepID=UPI003A99456D
MGDVNRQNGNRRHASVRCSMMRIILGLGELKRKYRIGSGSSLFLVTIEFRTDMQLCCGLFDNNRKQEVRCIKRWVLNSSGRFEGGGVCFEVYDVNRRTGNIDYHKMVLVVLGVKVVVEVTISDVGWRRDGEDGFELQPGATVAALTMVYGGLVMVD